jgi:HAMP domain-containing protein
MNDVNDRQDGLKWFQRIGNRIILTSIIAAVLPLLLISGTIGFKVRNDLVRQTVLVQKQRTATIQHGIESLFNSYYEQIESLSQIPAIQSMNPEQQHRVIHEFLEQQKIFFSCSVYGIDRSIKSVALRNRKDQAEIPPENFSSSQHKDPLNAAFANVVSSAKPAFVCSSSPAFQGKMLFVLVPVFNFVDSNEMVGLISCSISLSDPGIHEIICGYPIESEDILTLTDKEGFLISWQGNLPDNFAGLEISQQIADLSEGVAVKVDIASKTYLGTISAVPGVDGFLLAAKPWNLAMAFLNQLLLDLALVFTVALVIAVGLGFFMARSLAESISALIEGIKEVSRGVISHRVEVVGDDELTEAAKAFNEMVDTLEKHRMIDEIWQKEWQPNSENGNEQGD